MRLTENNFDATVGVFTVVEVGVQLVVVLGIVPEVVWAEFSIYTIFENVNYICY